MLVELMKQEKAYTAKDGTQKIGLSLYVQAGDQVIGIQPVYYGTETNPDKGYVARKAILSAMASQLPPKNENTST